MPRKPRMEFSGALYHVMNRGNYRQDLFNLHKTGQAFEETLFEACERLGWRLHAYVIMKNHFHLALETPEPNLVSGMQWLQSTFANRFNRFIGAIGHVFQGRYKALIVEGGAALLRVVNYIHLNPVRSKIVTVEELRRFRLSSYGRFFKGWRPSCLVNAEWLEEAGGWTATASGMRAYGRYLALLAAENPTERENLARSLTSGWYIGSDEGKKAFLREWYANQLESDQEMNLRDHGVEGAELLLEMGLKKLRKSRKNLSMTPKGCEFKLALGWWIKSQTGVTNRWLSENLNMGHITNVSGQVARYGRERAHNCPYRKSLMLI